MKTNTLDLTALTVGELAVEVPGSIRIFEAWKIDYCCGGQMPLTQACAAAGKTVEAFEAALDTLAGAPHATTRDWSADSLTTMAIGIVSTYHAYTREELQTLDPLSRKVLGVHGGRARADHCHPHDAQSARAEIPTLHAHWEWPGGGARREVGGGTRGSNSGRPAGIVRRVPLMSTHVQQGIEPVVVAREEGVERGSHQ